MIIAVAMLALLRMQDSFCVHLYLARAKHDRRQFISENQRFTAGMLLPYEYICKNKMHLLHFSMLFP
ncbi:MAG: hypothetical protein EAZ09_14750 [Oscillatoriales cyanobacterium]|nr:MAG: hypothetical protein EAZ18_17180 [Oscillatoriales cyanobacterium]TAH20172.1 MAG: hypothetical protein EAZ09_14750 [Oscillatoriales cyanobacterium]